jgi:hypothetical protein
VKPVQRHCYTTLILIVGLLGLGLLGAAWFWQPVLSFFKTGQSTTVGIDIGILLNGFTITLFLFGLLRMSWLVLDFAHEQGVIRKFAKRAQDGVDNPAYELPRSALIVQRYDMVQTIARQHAMPDQNTMAASLQAKLSTEFTFIRFVNNTLILTGVFGTVVSLSLALVGAAQLFSHPEDTAPMGAIINSMSTALSTTVTAIICYALFSYLNLRLQDIRTELQSNVEDVTMVYIMPRFQVGESAIVQNVAALAAELRQAAELVTRVQDRFLQAGERLQVAVDDLHHGVQNSSYTIQDIRETLREGFRLPPAVSTPPDRTKLEPKLVPTEPLVHGVKR